MPTHVSIQKWHVTIINLYHVRARAPHNRLVLTPNPNHRHHFRYQCYYIRYHSYQLPSGTFGVVKWTPHRFPGMRRTLVLEEEAGLCSEEIFKNKTGQYGVRIVNDNKVFYRYVFNLFVTR